MKLPELLTMERLFNFTVTASSYYADPKKEDGRALLQMQADGLLPSSCNVQVWIGKGYGLVVVEGDMFAFSERIQRLWESEDWTKPAFIQVQNPSDLSLLSDTASRFGQWLNWTGMRAVQSDQEEKRKADELFAKHARYDVGYKFSVDGIEYEVRDLPFGMNTVIAAQIDDAAEQRTFTFEFLDDNIDGR